ncbi:MAG: sugar phosphate isomerase/epimerase family protein [Candidatus Solibacter sp.]
MNLAVSNIAWPASADEEAARILHHSGIGGIEIAPTRLWPEWKGASRQAAEAAKARCAAMGLSVAALQAILFGKPEYKLFGSAGQREDLVNHLRFCAEMAAALGARSLVFGAPKNRELCGLTEDAAFAMARECFAAVAPDYERHGVCLCLEANPPQYGCQFLTDSAQAARMVRAVDSPGLRLHLDTACMYLAGEDLPAAVRSNFDLVSHFHVSEPFLASMEAPLIDHAQVAGTLRELKYTGWVSLEMREAAEPSPALRQAVAFLARTYGGEF